MKRTLAVFLALLLVLSMLTACSKPSNQQESSGTQSEAEDSTQYYYGEIGQKMSNVFFDFTVDDVQVSNQYQVSEGDILLDVTVTITNTYGEELPMFNGDFFLSYGDGDEDYCFGSLPEGDSNQDNMPESWSLKANNTVTYHLYYQVPGDATDFYFVYVEYYENDTFGDYYCIYFTLS